MTLRIRRFEDMSAKGGARLALGASLLFLASAAVSVPRASDAVSDPVIAAAGDIACGEDTSPGAPCEEMKTSDLLVQMNPAAVLPLGDVQYEMGQYQYFLTGRGPGTGTGFDPTWGRLKSVTRPAVGNHEYGTAGAAGYFDYFNGSGNSSGPAGDRTKGYYSYDVGNWHIVALNSNCSKVVPSGCGAGSAQEQWLRADLAAHPRSCTLAYLHHPRWSSSERPEYDTPAVHDLFQALYDYGTELLLAGHAHFYERFAPQDPFQNLDRDRGVRQIIVGTGGRSVYGFGGIEPNSEVRGADTFGVLKLTLHPSSYDWEFVPIPGQTFRDSGSDVCHEAGTEPPPPPPPAAGTTLFSDNFETGDLSQWDTSVGLVVQQQEVYGGSHAARGTSTGTATYASKQLVAERSELLYGTRFKLVSKGSNTVNLLKLRTSGGSSLLGLYVSSTGKLGYRNDVAGVSTTSSTDVGTGVWHELRVRARINGTAGETEVWFNGARIDALSKTESLSTTPIGRIQLGENSTGRTYDVVFDDVVVQAPDEVATLSPTITSAPVTTGTIGHPYSYQATASGTPPVTWSLVGGPAGMTIEPGSGAVSWTPAAAGNYPVEIRASNSAGSDLQSYTITVADPPLETVTLKVTDGYDRKNDKTLVQDGNKQYEVNTSDNHRLEVDDGWFTSFQFAQTIPAGAAIRSVKLFVEHYEEKDLRPSIKWGVGVRPVKENTPTMLKTATLTSSSTPGLLFGDKQERTEVWDVTPWITSAEQANTLKFVVVNEATNGKKTKLDRIYAVVTYVR